VILFGVLGVAVSFLVRNVGGTLVQVKSIKKSKEETCIVGL
jgi:hypothetical protein